MRVVGGVRIACSCAVCRMMHMRHGKAGVLRVRAESVCERGRGGQGTRTQRSPEQDVQGASVKGAASDGGGGKMCVEHLILVFVGLFSLSLVSCVSLYI